MDDPERACNDIRRPADPGDPLVGFGLKRLDGAGFLGACRQDALDGEVALPPPMPDPIDLAHSSLAENALDLVQVADDVARLPRPRNAVRATRAVLRGIRLVRHR